MRVCLIAAGTGFVEQTKVYYIINILVIALFEVYNCWVATLEAHGVLREIHRSAEMSGARCYEARNRRALKGAVVRFPTRTRRAF